MEQFLLIFTSLFTMINPIAAVPLYISLTQPMSRQTRYRVIITATVTAFVAMAIFAWAGEAIFKFFHINVNGLRVVGGVMFFIMGFEMLRGRTVPKKLDGETHESFGKDIAVTPLAIPMICGPGAITMVLLFMQEASSQLEVATLFGAMLAVCLATALIFALGEQLLQLLGQVGASVMMRLMGLIMMLIAVEFFFAGIGYYVNELGQQLQ
ncbi:MarC family protein [Saliniradius amylolyticus]|nr:MarC family protein [Saliniradius amylolyticus]